MAVVSRIAKLEITDGSQFRRFIATAATQDTAAGGSVVTTITIESGGLLPPGSPTTFTLRYVDDAGNIIRSVTLDNTTTPQTDTFHFTTTGAAGGTNRCGTIQIKLQATRTSGGPTSTYDVETDGSPNTPPTGFSTSLDQGWIRGTTTLTEDISNTSLGGAPTAPAQYDESLFVRLTQADASYVARAISVAVSNTSPALSANTNSSATVTHDVTFSNVVDNRFPAAVTAVGVTATVPNPTLATGNPDWAYTSTTEDTLNTDPRLTVAHLLQVDDSSVGTPPLSKNVSSGQRLASQLGYVAANFRTARGTQVGNVITGGVNSLSWSFSLQDSAAQTTPITSTGSTVTRGGEAGWTAFMQWSSQLPGGTWNNTTTITAPSDITGAGYLVGGVGAFTLLAIDPSIQLISGGGPASGSEEEHFSPGMALVVGGAFYNTDTRMTVEPDSSPVPYFTLTRLNQSTGEAQYLKTDFTWSDFEGAAADTHELTVSPTDPTVFTKALTAAQTSTDNGWSSTDLFLVTTFHLTGTPYSHGNQLTSTGAKNKHSGYSFNPIIGQPSSR